MGLQALAKSRVKVFIIVTNVLASPQGTSYIERGVLNKKIWVIHLIQTSVRRVQSRAMTLSIWKVPSLGVSFTMKKSH